MMADNDLRNPITIITVPNREYVFEKRGSYAEPMCTYIVILLYYLIFGLSKDTVILIVILIGIVVIQSADPTCGKRTFLAVENNSTTKPWV